MNEQFDENDDQGEGLLTNLPAMLWQRRRWIMLPIFLSSLIGSGLAFLLPPRYRSSATLLVESPQLPNNLTGGAGADGNIIDKRIAKVRQQILSRPDLIELINGNELYPKERQRKPLSEVVETMRKATSIEPVSANIQTGGQTSNTIAFSLSFDYADPVKAQIVAQDFIQKLLQIDQTQTAQQAGETVEFLEQQSTALQTQIATLEARIQGIKSSNGAALSSAGTLMLGGNSGGGAGEVAALQRENSQLQSQLNQQATALDRDPAVLNAEAQLSSARAVYADDHPDVRIAEQRLAQARQLAQKNIKSVDVTGAIRSQIASNNAAIANLQSARSSDAARTAAVMASQSRAPAVAEQVAQLQAQVDGLRTNYQTVATNLLNARGSAKLSEQQKGERLSLIEPPVVPDQPVSPNRPLLMIGSLIVGTLVGLGLAIGLEFLLRPVRGVDAVRRLTGAPPLVVIPVIESKGQRRRWWSLRRRTALPAG